MPADGAIGMNPDPLGLTGLESRFWWTGTDAMAWTLDTGTPGIAADCTFVPPPTLTLTAAIAWWDWDLGRDLIINPNTGRHSPQPAAGHRPGQPCPGSPENWAVGYVYETKSRDRVVSVTATWIADDPSLPPLTVPAGSRPHPVQEVRSVLVE